jgi:hypothetical protein
MDKSNTKSDVVEEKTVDSAQFEIPQWSEILEKELQELEVKVDLEQTARESKALIRRRGVENAANLLRIVLAYSHLDFTLRKLGMWCVLLKVSFISKTALYHRLQKCEVWLGKLIVLFLMQLKLSLPNIPAVRIKLVDASVICQPGSTGTDWRLHLGFDLNNMCMDTVEVTDKHGGENFTRFSPQAGELYIADRGYAFRESVGHVLVSGAWLLVRVGWLKLPFEDEQGKSWDPIAWLRQAHLLPGGQPQEARVWVTTPQGRFEIRFLARALPSDAAEEARRRVRKQAKKNKKGPDERSLFAAGFVLLATNLPVAQWTMPQIFDIYRFRWQVELVFKRLKSLLALDGLRAKDPQLAMVYLLGKVLAALLIERIQLGLIKQYAEPFSDVNCPLSQWRLTALLADHTRDIIQGEITLERIFEAFPLLLRYLQDEPRKRISQRAQAQAILSTLCAC